MMRGSTKHTLAERDPEHHVRMSGATHAYVYVLPCRHEDILKVGFSRDPLERMQSLHPRYFEFFDLERAVIVATESVGDARELEVQLFEVAALHRAPGPLVVAAAAGGHTEWFRGADRLVREAEADRAASAGYVLHAPALRWLCSRMQRRAGELYELTTHLLRAIEAARAYGDSACALHRQLRNLLDAHDSMGLDVAAHVPPAVLRWYRPGGRA
jgi:hypothetical protein